MLEVSRYIIKVTRITDKEWYYLESNELWDPGLTKNKDEAHQFTISEGKARCAAINFNGTYNATMIRITPTADAMMQRNYHARQRIRTVARRESYFLTLTQDPSKVDRKDVKKVRQAVKNAMRGLDHPYYYAVFELHKKGGWHVHILADTQTANQIADRWGRGFTFIEKAKAGFVNKHGKWIHIENELLKYTANTTIYTKPMFSRSLEREIQARKEIAINNDLGEWIDHYRLQKMMEDRYLWERRKPNGQHRKRKSATDRPEEQKGQ